MSSRTIISGAAALNARELQYHLRHALIQVPAPVLEAYPEARRLVTPPPETAFEAGPQ
jgi:hypothetical protein